MRKMKTTLVEPKETDVPIRRRRGKAKRRLDKMQPLGKITNFFVKMQVPKECSTPEMNGMVGGMKRKTMEPEQGLEQDLVDDPPTSRPRMMENAGSPTKFANFGG